MDGSATRRLLLAGCLASLCVLIVAVAVREWSRSDSGAAISSINDSTGRQESARRNPGVPALPFPTNPDPSQCGIPVLWTGQKTAWLTGIYHGELVEPRVFLYDSHVRRRVTASAPHGTRVRVVLQQSNPVLDFYFVRVIGDPTRHGWVPAPFL